MTPEELKLLEEFVVLEEKRRGVAKASPMTEVMEGGKDILRGMGKTGEFLLGGAGNLHNLMFGGGRRPTDALPPVQGQTEKLLPTPPGASTSRQFARSALEGAGGAAIMPGSLPLNLLAGAAGGAGGEAGARVAPKGFEQAGGTAGAFVGGGSAAALLPAVQRLIQSLGTGRKMATDKVLTEAMSGVTPWQMAEARGNVRSFANADSRTATLAEAFPGDNPVLKLGEQAKNQNLVNALQQRLTYRRNELEFMPEDVRELMRMPPGGGGVDVGLGPAATGVRPWWTTAHALSQHRETKIMQEIANLLATPSPGNLRQLETLMARDPNLKARLMIAGVLPGAAQERN